MFMDKKAFKQFVLIATAVVLLSLLYFFYPATANTFYPRCIFHTVTGLDCPGCGSQRAASALLHGHLLDALNFNLLFVAVLPFVAYSAFVYSWNIFSNKKIRQRFFYSPFFVKAILLLVIVFWIARNIPARPFNWLKA